MALTITYPNRVTPAYNPILIEAQSDVTDLYTIGAGKTITSITSVAGFCYLAFEAVHLLQQGDYILITDAPGAEYLEGVCLVTRVVDTDTLIINKPFSTGLSADATAFKYLNNYGAYVKIYVYTSDAPSTAKLVGDLTAKPKFEGGFCKFIINMASVIKDYNWNAFTIADVLQWDLLPSGSTTFVNKKSFVHWGVEIAEAFDNPTGGLPTYIQDIDA